MYRKPMVLWFVVVTTETKSSPGLRSERAAGAEGVPEAGTWTEVIGRRLRCGSGGAGSTQQGANWPAPTPFAARAEGGASPARRLAPPVIRRPRMESETDVL